MNTAQHKLCIALEELEQERAVCEEMAEELEENAVEIWQFDPGICG